MAASNAELKTLGDRIRDIRLSLGLSMSEFAERVDPDGKAKSGTVSNWEHGKNAPNAKRLKKIAELGHTSVQDLYDPNGWKLWEVNTGHSRSEIELEISRMKKAGRVADGATTQQIISQAVSNLEGRGKTDSTAVMFAARAVNDISDEVANQFYFDPRKISKLKKLGNTPIIPASKMNDGSLLYDDMDNAVLQDIWKILQSAKEELYSLNKKHRLN